MTDAIQHVLTLLAREINARQQPELVNESLRRFERRLSLILFQYGFQAANESGSEVLSHFSIKSSHETMTEAIRRWLRGYSEARARVIAGYLRDRIQEELSRGLSEEETNNSILKIIHTRGSAQRISRTEVHTALERGAWEAARSLGTRIIKEWVAIEDHRTRPDHARADGQFREIDEPFSVGGEALQYPGDPAASARQVVNCRCTALYHLNGGQERRKGSSG